MTTEPQSVERWTGCYEGSRDGLFTKESNRHPAKMAVLLCFRIIEHGERMGYWKKGDTILDPMAGIGTTLICGALFGYRVLGVELELHFLKLAQENIAAVRHKFQGTGSAWIVQGDARNLRAINLDGAITSPPYGDARLPPGVSQAVRKLALEEKWEEAITLVEKHEADQVARGSRVGVASREAIRRHIEGALQSESGYSGVVSSPPYADTVLTAQSNFLHRTPKLGEVPAAKNPRERYDAVLSSPPYGDSAVMAGSGVAYGVLKVAREQGMDAAVKFYRTKVIDAQKAHGRWSDENIRRHIEMALATAETGGYAVGVISSPPYSEALSGGDIAKKGHFDDPSLADRQYMPEHHGSSSEQIGNLRDPKGDIDAVLSSPPYSDQRYVGGAQEKEGRIQGTRGEAYVNLKGGETDGQIGQLHDDQNIDAALSSPPYQDTMSTGQQRGQPSSQWVRDRGLPHNKYGNTKGQIGNAPTSETYLSAMLQVYSSLYSVLKVGGVVALVTKNPVKDKAIRRLDLDTVRIMEVCGFKLLERKMAMLSEEVVHGDLFLGETRKKRQRKSFFKRLHEKKHPHLAVDHEDVLFFRKP